MKLRNVFNAKFNAINVLKNPIYVYLVTELIGFHGMNLIMIVCKHYINNYY